MAAGTNTNTHLVAQTQHYFFNLELSHFLVFPNDCVGVFQKIYFSINKEYYGRNFEIELYFILVKLDSCSLVSFLVMTSDTM